MPKATALITGASSGIGAELAKLCAADGYSVILAARDKARLEQLASELARTYHVSTRAVPCDLSDPAGQQSLLEQTRGGSVEIHRRLFAPIERGLIALNRAALGLVNRGGLARGLFGALGGFGKVQHVVSPQIVRSYTIYVPPGE